MEQNLLQIPTQSYWYVNYLVLQYRITVVFALIAY